MNPIPVNALLTGISGASGMPYAAAFLNAAFNAGLDLHVIISPAARAVIAQEMDHPCGADGEGGGLDVAAFCANPAMAGSDRITLYDPRDLTSRPASGSFRTRGMVIVPCSMRSVGALAAGVADNLLLRAAECQLKEGRRVVIVPRETPLSLIHLENLTRLARAGVVVAPAAPAYYYHPRALADHERFLVTRLCDQFDIPYPDAIRWRDGSDGLHG